MEHEYYPKVTSLGEAWRQPNDGDDFGYEMKEKSPEVETELDSFPSADTPDYTTYPYELGWRTQAEYTEESYLGHVSVQPPGPPPELPKTCTCEAECKHD